MIGESQDGDGSSWIPAAEFLRDLCNQAVASARDGLDDLRIFGVIPERFAQLRNGISENFIADVRVRPDCLDDLLLR